MSSHTFDPGSQLERLMNDRRVRIGGLIAGALVILSSLVVVNVSNAPSRSTRSVAVLPDVPLNIPIMRQWPFPRARAAAAASATPVTARAPGARVVKRGVLTARR